jgi:hypothetical protein
MRGRLQTMVQHKPVRLKDSHCARKLHLLEALMIDFSVLKDPWILGGVLLIPVLVIGLAKSWKVFQAKYAEKKGQAG